MALCDTPKDNFELENYINILEGKDTCTMYTLCKFRTTKTFPIETERWYGVD